MPPSLFSGFYALFLSVGIFPLKSECFFWSTLTWKVLSLECECFPNRYKALGLFAVIFFFAFSLFFFSPYVNHPSRFSIVPHVLALWRFWSSTAELEGTLSVLGNFVKFFLLPVSFRIRTLLIGNPGMEGLKSWRVTTSQILFLWLSELFTGR